MKRILSCLIAAVLLFSCISISADYTSDITAENYEQTVALINALGIADRMSEKASDVVTRGEFVYTLISALRIDVTTPSDKSYYADMSNHYANTATVAARDMGIISSAEYFNPDEKITLAQALKMCMIATGYQIQAATYGGYPEGYLIASMFSGHLDGIKIDNNERGITVYEAKLLLYNTLTADLMKQTMFGDSYEFQKVEGANILSEYYSIYEFEGILTRTANSSVDYYSEPAGKGKTSIEDITFNYDDNCEELLGHNVSAFYEEYDGVKTLLTITPKRNKVEYLYNGNFTFDGNLLTYSEKNGSSFEDYKIARSYSLIYNGKAYSGDINDVLTSGAAVRLVSNNNDQIYDIIFVDVTRYTYVSYVDYENKIIYDVNSPANNIFLNDKDIYYSVLNSKTDEYESFESIESGTVIGSVVSEDGLYVKITICSGNVVGKVSEIDYTNNRVYIDGFDYYISSYFEENYGDITHNVSYDILLGNNGELVVPSDTSADMHFGILVDIQDDSSAFKQPDIKIFTEKGKMLISKLSKRVTVDNNNMSASEAVAILAPGGNVKRQLIRYGLDENGDVLTIDTKEPGDPSNRPESSDLGESINEYDLLRLHRFGEPDASAEGDNPTDSDIPTQTYTYMFKSSGAMFYPKFNARNAIIFVIPTDANANDDEKYSVSTDDVFGDDDEYTDLDVSVYNINEYGQAEAVVYISDSTTSTPKSSTKSAVVEKITTAYDKENDEIKRKVSVWSQGKFSSYFIDEDVTISKTSGNDLCPGDIIRFTYVDDTIVSVLVDFDASPDVFTNNGSVSFNAKNGKIQYQKGMIYSLKGSYAYIDPTADAISGEYEYNFSNLKHFTISTSNVLIINMDRTESGLEFVSLQPATAAELLSYKATGEFADYIVLRQSYLSPEVTFVYRITDR